MFLKEESNVSRGILRNLNESSLDDMVHAVKYWCYLEPDDWKNNDDAYNINRAFENSGIKERYENLSDGEKNKLKAAMSEQIGSQFKSRYPDASIDAEFDDDEELVCIDDFVSTEDLKTRLESKGLKVSNLEFNPAAGFSYQATVSKPGNVYEEDIKMAIDLAVKDIDTQGHPIESDIRKKGNRFDINIYIGG